MAVVYSASVSMIAQRDLPQEGLRQRLLCCMDAMLSKPIQVDELLGMLQKHLGVSCVYEVAECETAALEPAPGEWVYPVSAVLTELIAVMCMELRSDRRLGWRKTS